MDASKCMKYYFRFLGLLFWRMYMYNFCFGWVWLIFELKVVPASLMLFSFCLRYLPFLSFLNLGTEKGNPRALQATLSVLNFHSKKEPSCKRAFHLVLTKSPSIDAGSIHFDKLPECTSSAWASRLWELILKTIFSRFLCRTGWMKALFFSLFSRLRLSSLSPFQEVASLLSTESF